MNELSLGSILGVRLGARPSALWTSIVLWAVWVAAAVLWLDLSPAEAALAGVGAVAIHWFSELCHQFGHALAARRTGYPMESLSLAFFLIASRYPQDEPPLPARLHIRRALGGPAASFVLSLISAPVAWALRGAGGIPFYLAALWFLENFAVGVIGAFFPLGFNDGSTLLRWWGRE